MKRIRLYLILVPFVLTLFTSCGQTPVSPDSSLPQDVSTTTTTTTTEETTTTTAEEITVTVAKATTPTKNNATTTATTTEITTTVKSTTTTTAATDTKPAVTTTRPTANGAILGAAVFDTENIYRITFYSRYGRGKVRDVPDVDKKAVTRWLKTFTIKEKVSGLLPPGTNTYHVEIEYLDGTIVKQGLDVIEVNGEQYYIEHTADSYYELDMILGKEGTTTTESTTTTTTRFTPVDDPEAPPADRQQMELRFDGRVITFRYDSKEIGTTTGRLLWKYSGTKHGEDYDCKVDAETGLIIYISGNVKLGMSVFIDETKMRTYFANRFAECGLSSDYMDKAEYTINYVGGSATEPPFGAPTATVTIQLNDAGDVIEWTIADAIRMCISSIKVKLADPDVYPDELANFYVPTYIG